MSQGKNGFMKKTAALFLVMGMLLMMSMSVFAQEEKYLNPETGYRVYVSDEASLLEAGEEQALIDKMKEITAYGGAAFVTCSAPGSTSDYARERYRGYFGKDSGMLFMIDMAGRKIWIFSDGDVYRTISRPKANQIADNVYRYAKKGRYGDCALAVFDQAGTLLEGGRIYEGMKHIVNVLLAAIAALMICYLLVSCSSMGARPSRDVILEAGAATLAFTAAAPVFKRQTKKYSPVHTSGGGGGGGGGGGSSGGGGGHSF